jgi:hypothetical protein
MARRGNPRGGRRHHARDDRPFGLGTHWRSDGQPKTAYATELDAWAMAEERRHSAGVNLNVYRCDVCRSWHMGNPPGTDR